MPDRACRRRTPNSPPARSRGATYTAEHRRRAAQGRKTLRIEFAEVATIGALINAGRITETAALDENAVAKALEQLITDAIAKL